MEKWSAVARIVVPIFTAVALGALSRKKKLLTLEENRGLQDFVVKFGLPCVLFNSTITATVGTEAILPMGLLLVLMLMGSWVVGLSGVTGGVTGDTGSSLPPHDMQQSTAMQTEAIKDACFTTCFIIINFRLHKCY